MNSIRNQLLFQSIPRKKKNDPEIQGYSRFQRAKKYREFRASAILLFKDISLILLGIGGAAFGLEGFLMPNRFIDGGATGISLLLAELTSISLPVLLVLINIPFILVGYKVIGKQFAVRASLAILGLATVVALVNFPVVTEEKLLVAVFGGFFLGAGIGLAIRGGAVLDGTEILAIAISRKLRTTIGDIIIIINAIIFCSAAYFLSVETALYSMITYLAASRTLDFVIEGIEEYTGITIISVHSEEIRLMITNSLGRGVTVYKGKRGFGKTGETREMDIIYTVITRLEISKLNAEIEKIDPNAFVVMNSIKDTKGGMIKKRPFKKH
jgi:uncharacterized membrane-anchored protein YitT (DUF2179 family)